MNATILLLAIVSIFRMGGDILVDDAPDGAALRTMGGDIDVARLEGSAKATTMGGNIEVNVVTSGAGHDLELHAMGGEIEVTLPRGFDGEFSVELEDDDNGAPHKIKSDFPLQIRESSRWLARPSSTW